MAKNSEPCSVVPLASRRTAPGCESNSEPALRARADREAAHCTHNSACSILIARACPCDASPSRQPRRRPRRAPSQAQVSLSTTPTRSSGSQRHRIGVRREFVGDGRQCGLCTGTVQPVCRAEFYRGLRESRAGRPSCKAGVSVGPYGGDARTASITDATPELGADTQTALKVRGGMWLGLFSGGAPRTSPRRFRSIVEVSRCIRTHTV